MSAEPSADRRLAVEVRRFGSAEEALLRQDRFEGSSVAPDRPALLIWMSPRALLAAPADSRLKSFAQRARACTAAGWPVATRRGGGLACPVSPGTLQLAISRPASSGVTVDSAYGEMASLLETLLARLGLVARRGTCEEAFCPGRYDISVDGRKVAGLAQVWRRIDDEMTVITGASLVCDEEASDLAEAVNLFYRGVPDAPFCRADAIGSLGRTLGRRLAPGHVARLLQMTVEAGGEPA